ncbi:hypothetical protein Sjap_006921 [Stephania japonica]|uniref:Trichome birefringence-like N-terminal domain-containing protein n=1 Tax=Stephania japonica TaxID=461633 RepID=A0AAP0K8I7_9MAGN
MEVSIALTCPLYRSRKSKIITIALLLSISLFSCFSLNLASNPSAPSAAASTVASSRLLVSSHSLPSPQIPSIATPIQISRQDAPAKDLNSCDVFDGRWLFDESSPIYAPGSCPFVDDAFNCVTNGRPDLGFQRLRWVPNQCHLPRFDGKKMLEILRGKRVVFVGDSLNRNMWESMVCALRDSLEDKNRVFEVSGRRDFRSQGFYAFKFEDYNASIEFVRSPFLVQEWDFGFPNGDRKETLRLDLIQKSSSMYRNSDIIVFNTGHWWTHEKTSQGKNYYQVGDYVFRQLSVAKAYKKALETWAHWVDTNINSTKTKVFFRGYSASHFKGGQWSSGGNCDGETAPITNDAHLLPYPQMMNVLESVLQKMKTPVFYLNITKMTDYRKDGHPSIYRQPETQRVPGMFQDCSHWCLPGVPDAWNELLYAALLITQQ